MKKIVVSVLTAFLIMGVFAFGSTAYAQDVAGEKVVTVGTTSAWATLVHASNITDSNNIFGLPVFDVLFTLSAKGEFIPRLVESYEFSEDGTTLTAHIRQNAYWHDGEQVTTKDILYTAELLANPDFDSSLNDTPVRYVIGTDDSGKRVEGEEFGYQIVDDYTFQIINKVPTSELNFLYQMRVTYVLPEHILGGIPAAEVAADDFWNNPVGSGPFIFDSMIEGERIEYTTFKDYYLGAADFDRLVIRVIPENNMISAIMSGEVDITARGSQVSMSDFEMAKGDDSLVTYSADGFSNVHIIINNQKIEKNVRVAMDCAIDKESIVNDFLYGNARVAISAIVPENPYRKEGIEGNAYDPEHAKELLREAGWVEGDTITMQVRSDNQLYGNIAAMIQQNLKDAGINLVIENYDNSTIMGNLFAGEFECSIQQSASNAFEPSESFFYFYDVADQGWLQIPKEEGYVDIYQNGLKGTTIEERRVYYDELQEKLVEDVPMIFLYHPNTLFVNSMRISNVPYENIALNGWNWWEWEVTD